MIEILEKKDCCGCSACVERCPVQCITLKEDSEGFLYPKVDKDICIDCHLCEKVCPVLNKMSPIKPIAVYAAINSNEQERFDSSSGGLFIAFAKVTINKGGVVFGAVMDDGCRGVHHTYSETLEGLKPLMRSKYVQSRMETAYLDCERFLKSDRRVLFTGTSCQIAGLLHFLRKPYENLLTIDVICHGVPSPKVWRRYLDEEIFNIGSALTKKNTVLSLSQKSVPVFTGVNFRDKVGYGWKKYGFSLYQKSDSRADKNSVFLSNEVSENPYMRVFLSDLCLRPSCHACVAKDGCSHSDITIADYWGIQNIMPDYDDDKGMGLLIVNSHKGEVAVEGVDINKRISDLETAVRYNPSYRQSKDIPIKRLLFFRLFDECKANMKSIADICLNPSLLKQICTFLSRFIHKIDKIADII